MYTHNGNECSSTTIGPQGCGLTVQANEGEVASVKTESKRRWQGKVTNTLAQCWEAFVDCPQRLVSEAPFLRRAINRYKRPRVLDAAMGIGCEVLWLVEQGVEVVGNEIEVDLQAIAQRRASAAGVTINTTAVDWRCLTEAFGEKQFDVVLLLGNSLSLLRELRDRRSAAKELFRVCRDSGQLIVDERNFRYILNNRDEIIRGEFKYSQRVIYCGKSIIGRPVQITDDCIRFGYFDGDTLIGTLDMHPFGSGELIALFLEAGFSSAAIYSDFERGYREKADFFTYVLTM
jgi:2-polyprenyl-3-methyl-5-hydroxy-6-metoxy-1,4-benzoquinol methylase